MRTPLRRDDGQAIVEMALVLPILCALLLGIAQFGIAYNNYVTLTDATRAGARKAAVARFTNDQGAAAKAAVYTNASNLNSVQLQVTVSVDNNDWTTAGNNVTVTAQYPYSINILGWVVKSGNLTSTQQERLE
jgi:Flp pilus assembly protein TadG